jgi:outer membrane protein assembly factor BamB
MHDFDFRLTADKILWCVPRSPCEDDAMTGLRAILLLLLVVPASRADDWPQWLGPKRDNVTNEKVIPWKDKETPKKLWEQPVGPGYSVPTVAGDRVFVHDRIVDKEQEQVVAYEAKTGKEIWRDVYDRAPYSSVLNTGPQASPTIAGNKVYTYGITGVLSCYQAEDGKRLWQVDAYKHL